MEDKLELPESVSEFLAAVNARDAARAGAFLTDDISYQFLVPHPAIEGRGAVVAALDKSLKEADAVRWEVVSFGLGESSAFVERLDRFWFGGRESAIECAGVFELRDGLIAAVRDYADLATWRERKGTASR